MINNLICNSVENKIIFSDIESKRFKMNIARSKMEDIQIKDLSNFISEHKIDVTILRIPTEKIEQASKLEQLGFPFIQADTLVYYKADLTKYQNQALKNGDLDFVLATMEDVEDISPLIASIFPGYTNHYNANPFIDIQNVLLGYNEWVVDFIDANDKFVFLVRRDGKNIGFASCSIIEGVAEGVLYGVLPEASGGGVYSDIIRYTQDFFQKRGAKEMRVSTQVQNYGVQKVWSREGFYLFESFATFHINSLLNYTIYENKSFDINFSELDIHRAGKLSGDWNSVHFDDEFAKTLGFEKRITHGLLVNAMISRYFGTIYPGEGTLFMSYKYKFQKPIYPDRKYLAAITVPYHDKVKGIYLCVIKVLDEKENVCLLSYNYLLKK